MDDVRIYDYHGSDGNVVAVIKCHGTPDADRIKTASERFLKRVEAHTKKEN